MKGAPRLLLGLALVAGIALAIIYREHLDTSALTAWVAAAGPVGPLVFIGLYAIATVLFLPGSLLTLAGGALFGPLGGTLWNLTGATLGAAPRVGAPSEDDAGVVHPPVRAVSWVT